MNKKFFDIKKVFRTSKSPFYRYMPGFVINGIRKIVREDKLNELYAKYGHLYGIDLVKALLFQEFNVKIDIIGTENVNPNGRYTYIANHPLGAIDALGFLYLVYKIHGNVLSPSNKIFEYIPNLHELIVPVDVFGHSTKEQIQAVNEAFASEKQIMIFPAGEVSRFINGKIQDPQWHKTFLTKSVKYHRDIVPVFITGRNSNRFYKTAKIRKKLGLKIYIESLLLPDEMLKKYNAQLTYIIGKPISYKEIENSNISHKDWVEKIKNIVYKLGESYIQNQKL